MKIFELDPDFLPDVWEASVADLRERKTQFITTRHQRKDGSIIDVEIVRCMSARTTGSTFLLMSGISPIESWRKTRSVKANRNYRLLFETAAEGFLSHRAIAW